MFISCNEMNIAQIAESGQCFRMNEVENGTYGIIYKGKYLEITNRGCNYADNNYLINKCSRDIYSNDKSMSDKCLENKYTDNKYTDDICLDNNCVDNKNVFELSCDEDEYESIWKEYFDMDTDYSGIMNMVDNEDQFLKEAVRYGSGIRILRQDPWEMLISFIISQRKSIPAIRTSVERLSALCGDEIDTPRGIRYSFPAAERIAALSEGELDSCGLGYRSRYISEVAKRAAFGELDVYSMGQLTDTELKERLLGLTGVGVKVANCVMLFGYHRIDAFPEDVWIKRALSSYYPDGFPYDRYPGCGGVMQQYIFFYSRNGHI